MFLIYAALAVAAIILLVSYICAQMVFAVRSSGKDEPHLPKGRQYLERKDDIFALVAEAAALPYEDVYVESFDGLRLHGKLYDTVENVPVHILFHGYRSSALLDFGGGLRDVVQRGHNAILADQRAHSASEGRYLSFGINERRDCLAWIEYAKHRFGSDCRIIIEGVSMGAATVLMAAGNTLPENVIGVLADSAYSSPEKIIRHVMRKQHYPQLLFPFIRLGGRMFAGFDISSESPLEAMKSCKIPVFFIHGDDDRFVPYAMGRENYEACGAKKFFFTGQNAGHGLSYIVDTERYVRIVRSFGDSVLNENQEV